MATVFLGLGSNLGDRADMIRTALARLSDEYGVGIEKVSSFIETDPVGGPPQGRFINAVARVRTELTPQALLSAVMDIERQLGRVRGVPNGPRTIDIDILLYDSITVSTETLTIPHPRMRDRAFVMTPLREIQPDLTGTGFHDDH